MEMITYDIANSKYRIIANSLNITNDLWIYNIRQCIGYLEITHSIYSLITKRYMERSIEKDGKVDIEKVNKIKDLILENKF